MRARSSIFWLRLAAALGLIAGLLNPAISFNVQAATTDISGPTGSGAFGAGVFVLPNGNLVVTDPFYSPDGGTTVKVGAVYLYDGSTHTLISTLTGSAANDQVGSTGVIVLTDGNYVVRSMLWNNGPATQAGAVTWCSATTGCSGSVSAANSLVGSHTDDKVGSYGIQKLSAGNYLVMSNDWNAKAGAFSFCTTGGTCTGVVGAGNSLIGSTPDDSSSVSVTLLPDGSYLLAVPNWDNAGLTNMGAVVGCPSTGCTGPVSTSNSLHGVSQGDSVGTVTLLSGGAYVVSSIQWVKSGVGNTVGAVTYCASMAACNGQTVTTENSLTGRVYNDYVGSVGGVKALSNGDYVVGSPQWFDDSAVRVGAVTYCAVSAGASSCTNKTVTPTNSLIGTHAGDWVGAGLVALSGGGFVASTNSWDTYKGAVTYCGNAAACMGKTVDSTNSLVGTNSDPGSNGSTGDQVGNAGIKTLPSGGYVVNSQLWDNGGLDMAGAVTYCPSTGCTGPVSTANSLTGSAANDKVGENQTRVLTNGNYFVVSSAWDGTKGAVTFCTVASGASSCTGQAVSGSNSLVGSTTGDQLGDSNNSLLLSTGGYLISSPNWTNTATSASKAGALTFCPATGCTGPVSAANSLVGTTTEEQVGWDVYREVADNYYVAPNLWYSYGALTKAGSITLCSITTGCPTPISSENSVLGGVTDAGPFTYNNGFYDYYDYDVLQHKLVVGRPAENKVSYFPQDAPKTDTTLSLASSSTGNTSVFGESVTFTATVSPAAATGTVDFMEGTTAVCSGVALSSGQATCQKSDLTLGSHTLTAHYSGNASYNPSDSSSLTQTVNKADTSAVVSASVNPAKYGQSVNLTATVAVKTPGAGTPAGTVQFYDNGVALGSPVTLSGTTAVLTRSDLGVGSHPITAVFTSSNPNLNNSAASPSVSLVIQQAATTTTLSGHTPSPSSVGAEVTISWTVAVTAPGSGTPTGNVTITTAGESGSTCTAAVGAGSCKITFTSGGTKTLTATYAGDTNFAGSSSSTVNQTVDKLSTTTSLASSSTGNTSAYGEAVTFTATVSSASVAQGGTITGTVTFKEGSTELCKDVAVASNGTAPCTLSSLEIGGHAITAEYDGSTVYLASTSSSLTQTVNQADTTTTITSDLGHYSRVGYPYFVTVTVTSAGGTPGGTVTVSDGSQSCVIHLGTETSCLLTSITADNHKTITATYSGDTHFKTSSDSKEHPVWVWQVLMFVTR